MGEEKFNQIAFPMIGVDDSTNRIFFEAGDFNLEEFILYSYADDYYLGGGD